MSLVATQHVGSSRTRAWTNVPCIGRRILSHCTTGEAQYLFLLMLTFFFHHSPDIQLGKLQLVIRPLPDLSSHANRCGHTQWQGPSPQPQGYGAGGWGKDLSCSDPGSYKSPGREWQ